MADRQRLPAERTSITHRFEVGGLKGYVTVGLYPDGRPGELFIRVPKTGTIEQGLCNAVGILCSMCLQAGVPLADIVAKFKNTRFEPSGWAAIGGEKHFATSILDYIFRWLEVRFLGTNQAR